jgi:predicted  nucleic acid-binding Zn-ribbon protein
MLPLFSSIIPALLRYWKVILPCIILGGMFLWIKYDTYELKKSRDQVVQLTADMKTMNDNLNKAISEINVQNTAIDKMIKQSHENQLAMEELGTELTNLANDEEEKIDKLRAQPSPKTCEQGTKYLRESITELSWSKK